MTPLNELFRIQRRFMRSVNVERDGDSPDSLEGYVLTPRTADLAGRMLRAFSEPHRTRAWTLTGVYGTGKSSFANFATALFAARGAPVQRKALALLKGYEGAKDSVRLAKRLPEGGAVRAVATARREPVAHTVVRALARGSERFWSHRRGRNPDVVKRVIELADDFPSGSSVGVDVAGLAREIAEASRTGLILVIDELGKVLEHAAHTGGKEDLYLLQRLAELPAGPDDTPVFVVGLLHQAFSEYGQLLSSAEQAEWGKIQGRFEDVPFAEPADQMLRIIGQAIQFTGASEIGKKLDETAGIWSNQLRAAAPDPYIGDVLTPAHTREILPLHPITALVLPTLCARYGQNERSLFTFLASNEPHALSRFLDERRVGDDGVVPLLTLPALYDYFVDTANVGSANRVQMTRWAEIHTVVRESKGLPQDEIDALKTVGTLNLVSSAGPLRASKELVLHSLMASPENLEGRKAWKQILERLVQKGFLTYRTQVDEYRLWQGSDFDIEEAVREHLESERRSLAKILHGLGTPPPVVAQRHSYQTGTLRYFERRYADGDSLLTKIASAADGSDGIIAYWVDEEAPGDVPSTTAHDLPLVVIQPDTLQPLRSAALELAALLSIEKTESALQADGVARKELKKRIRLAREVLDHATREAFDRVESRTTWVQGQRTEAPNFNGTLSAVFDAAYAKGPTLWNEIINRRQLTSQGARAQRELISALLTAWTEPRFGIQGTGPDYSIYASVFEASSIHREDDGAWVLGPPSHAAEVSLTDVWNAIENFCLSAVDEARSLDQLYEALAEPPYGVREGLTPVLLAAVLVYHSEDVSVYQEGSFVPVLGPAHFELLVKRPDLFAVKHFELGGVKFSEYRKVLEQIGGSKGAPLHGVRNETLLNVVRPLIHFAVSLPEVTKNSTEFSESALRVRKALLSSREPDDLIFRQLPEACGYRRFRPGEKGSADRRKKFLVDLADAIRELRVHYDELLGRCQRLIHQAFGVRSGLGQLREDLRVRAQYLSGSVIEPRLNSFVRAALDIQASEREWLESIIMIIADRPADTWTDDDLMSFQINVGDMARQFANLEALQKEVARAPQPGFDSKRITITHPTGAETHRLVWVERDAEEQIRKKANKLLEQLDTVAGEHLRQAVLVELMERVLDLSRSEAKDQPDIDERNQRKIHA